MARAAAPDGRTRNVTAPTSLAGQFEQPYGPMGPPTLFTIPVPRYMKTYGLSHEQLAMVSVVQREWAAKNPRVTFGAPFTSSIFTGRGQDSHAVRSPPLAPSHVEWCAVSDETVFARLSATGTASSIQPLRNRYLSSQTSSMRQPLKRLLTMSVSPFTYGCQQVARRS